MIEAFHLGGWGMYPTALFGTMLVMTAGHYALRPGRLSPVIALGVLTLLASALGFVTGVIKTALSAGQMDPYQPGVVVTGFGESLVNVGFGLALAVLAAIGVCVGLARRSSELVDPTA